MNGQAALEELKQGNRRFLDQACRERTKRPADLAGGQSPHTIVLTCSDSRVPPEVLFDQDLGDLFVIRVAGNTAPAEAIGSAEYAAANLGSSLILVLGHTACGAVGAAVQAAGGEKLPSPALEKVVEPILRCVGEGKSVDEVVDLNVSKTLDDLLEKSAILRGLHDEGKLELKGGTYDLASGEVRIA